MAFGNYYYFQNIHQNCELTQKKLWVFGGKDPGTLWLGLRTRYLSKLCDDNEAIKRIRTHQRFQNKPVFVWKSIRIGHRTYNKQRLHYTNQAHNLKMEKSNFFFYFFSIFLLLCINFNWLCPIKFTFTSYSIPKKANTFPVNRRINVKVLWCNGWWRKFFPSESTDRKDEKRIEKWMPNTQCPMPHLMRLSITIGIVYTNRSCTTNAKKKKLSTNQT